MNGLGSARGVVVAGRRGSWSREAGMVVHQPQQMVAFFVAGVALAVV